jgi:hypothetical protein
MKPKNVSVAARGRRRYVPVWQAAAANILVPRMNHGNAEGRQTPRWAGQAEGVEPSDSVEQVIAARHRQGGGIAIPNFFNLL